MAPFLLRVFFCFGTCQDVHVEDVIQGLSDVDAAISTLSVTQKFEIVQRSIVARDQLVPLRAVCTTVAERAGRVRYEGISELFEDGPKPRTFTIRSMATFDGEIARVLEGTDDRFTSARITRNRADIPWRIDPWEIATRYFGDPVAEILKTHGAVIVGTAQADGRPVTVVESAPISNGENGKYRFSIDTARSFAVVRRSALTQSTPDDEWKEYTSIECFGYREAAPGIWLPGLAKHTAQLAAKGHSETLWSWTVHNQDWEVNSPRFESVFQLEVPPGVYVNDNVTGQKYTNARITDQMVADSATQAARLRELMTSMPTHDDIMNRFRGHSGWCYAFVAVGVVALPLAAWRGWIFMRRTNHATFEKTKSSWRVAK